MPQILIYYAHPGQKYSRVNRSLASVAKKNPMITFVDLYHEYPRYDIDIEREQQRLLEHDIIIFQHPLFWYSTPALIKEWIDLVLEHGFAFGAGGDKLSGKYLMNVTSAAGPQEAYSPEGYQHYPLRTLLTPLEQTARLCQMRYLAPYVLYSALTAQDDLEISQHSQGYQHLLEALSHGRYMLDKACQADYITRETVHQFIGSQS